MVIPRRWQCSRLLLAAFERPLTQQLALTIRTMPQRKSYPLCWTLQMQSCSEVWLPGATILHKIAWISNTRARSAADTWQSLVKATGQH